MTIFRVMRAAPAISTLAVLLATGARPVAALDRTVRFQTISVDKGLSQATINSIHQDERGFMWFGTEDGLNRFDGYTFHVYKAKFDRDDSLAHSFVTAVYEDREGVLWVATQSGLDRWNRDEDRFTHFKNQPEIPTSLSDDRVRVVFEDSAGQLWIGTDGGLNRFDREAQSFTRYNHNPSNPHSLQHDMIRAIEEDADGSLWIGTYGGGLDRFYPLTGLFEHHRYDASDPGSLSDDRVRALLRDENGNLWVGTERGFNRRTPESESFEHFFHNPLDPGSLSNDKITTLLQDSQGTLWVGTWEGLNALDPETGESRRYFHDPLDPASLGDDYVVSLFQDHGGILWVGTRMGGVSRWNSSAGAFVHFRHSATEPSSLSHDVVTAFGSEGSSTVWVGTFGGGLNRFERETGTFEHFRHDRADPGSLSEDRVSSIVIDSAGELWVGTFDGGLNRFVPENGTFEHFRHDPSAENGLSSDGIMTMYEDREGVLWIGTYGGGLNRLDRSRESFVHYRNAAEVPTSLGHDRVSALYEDSLGVLWVGTRGGGLDRFDRTNGTFSHYRHDPEESTSLSNEQVFSIYEDSRGTLWVGTFGTALNAWSLEDRRAHRGIFKRYTEEDGLPNAVVYGILEDDEGSLWLSTNRGISKLDPRTETFTNYDTAHGLQSREFNFGAYHEGHGGEMYFGGINGFNAFLPEQIRDNPHVPPIRLTGFFKFNERVELGTPVSDIREIALDYGDDVIAFEFAALDYTAPEKNEYAYKLEGFDQDWIQLGNLRRATYTNLDGGGYVFRVKGSNNDGVWNEEGASVRLRVHPPPWQTWWAYSIYSIVAITLFTTYSRTQYRKLEREAEYSRKLEQQVKERTQELAQRNEDLEVLNRKLEEASLTDALTGLGNRRFLLTHLKKEVSLTMRGYAPHHVGEDDRTVPARDLLLLMVDLDRYKEINDRYGHAAGDRILVQVKDILKQACRTSDTVVRWGGDEFLVAGRTSDRNNCRILAERIRSMIEAHAFEVGTDEPIYTTCSIGFASFPFVPNDPDLLTWEQVLAIADRALYVAKNSGRNSWVGLFSTESTPKEAVVEAILSRAEWLHRQGQLDVLTSYEDAERLAWATA